MKFILANNQNFFKSIFTNSIKELKCSSLSYKNITVTISNVIIFDMPSKENDFDHFNLIDNKYMSNNSRLFIIISK